MKEAAPMSHRKILFGLTLSVAMVGLTAAYAQNKPATPPAPGGAGGGRCRREADLQAARQGLLRSGDRGAPAEGGGLQGVRRVGRDVPRRGGPERTPASTSSRSRARRRTTPSCRSTRPTQKEVLQSPNDPFFSWKKVGKVVHDREGEVAQGGADGGELDRAVAARQGLLRQRQRVDEGLHKARKRPSSPRR